MDMDLEVERFSQSSGAINWRFCCKAMVNVAPDDGESEVAEVMMKRKRHRPVGRSSEWVCGGPGILESPLCR